MRASCAFLSLTLVGLGLIGLQGVVHAQSLEATEPSGQAASPEPEAKLAWSGRVFVGDTLIRRKVAGDIFWRNEQAVQSARVGLKYDHPEGLRVVIKSELSQGELDLKDGYIRLSFLSDFRLQAGRFKKPISSMALTSRWDLPSIERGLLDSVLVEGQSLPVAGGRGDGFMVDYRAPFLPGKSGLSVALLQNELGIGDVTLNAKEDFAQDPYLRLYVEPTKGLQLASSLALIGYLSEGDRDSFRHAPVGSLEVQYKGPWLLAWVEGLAGKSMFARVDGSTSGSFWGARVLLAPRFKPGIPRRLEPFVGASAFDPRTTDPDNANYEVQGGVNFAFAKEWRLQVEVSRVAAEGISSSATPSTAFRIQLGARFKE